MAYLVSVTGSRLPLRRGHRYIVGRGRDADIVLNDAMSSRHHAVLEVADGIDAVSVDDMDSRNGTYLNGRRIHGPTVIPDGGRLRVGRSVYILQLREEAPLEQLEETCTASIEPASGGKIALDGGELAALGTVETLRLLVRARRSVTMHVALPSAAARVELRDGEILGARHGGLSGFSALVKLGGEQCGIFWLVEASGPCDERNIHDPAVHVLFELGRHLNQLSGVRA
jgi:hypothetical protein